MQSQRRWLGILLVIALTLTAFAAVAYAASPEATAVAAPTADGDNDGLDATVDPNDADVDTDDDGLCDGPGNAPGCLAYNPAGGGEDVDADGVCDFPLETCNTDIDSDDDYLCDGPGTAPGCVATFGAGHGGEDVDADNDNADVGVTETDPRDVDTDNDKVPDGWVDGWWFGNPVTCGGFAGVDPARVDGIRDRWEGEDLNTNGVYDAVPNETDPLDQDTDDDQMPDCYESVNTCQNPGLDDGLGDNDGDGFVDLDGNARLFNYDEYRRSMNSCSQDTDKDGITDDWEYAFSNMNTFNYKGTLYQNANFCPDLNLDGFGEGVMNPTANDVDDDDDQDGASHLTEYKGIDKTAPFVPFTLNLNTNPSKDWTSPCNANSDNEDLNRNGVQDFFEIDWDGDGFETNGDNFIDGYEYWNRFDPNQVCTGNEMHPRANGDPDNGDAAYDNEGLTNINEYKGEDGVAPVANLTQLFPGDLANPNGWNYADPYFKFQTSGPASDATNACNADTDRGGVTDKLEFDTWDFNGWELDPNFKLDDAWADHDYDGLPSLIEDKNLNTIFDDITNWLDPDTDGDALCDGTLYYVLEDPDNIYPNPLPATINLQAPPYINPTVLLITDVLGGPKMFDLDNGTPDFQIVDDYICGGGEDLDRNGRIAGDVDNDRLWDVDEDLDNDGVMDLPNENDGPGGLAPPDDGDGHLSTAVELWTETDPARADTDDDDLCDGSVTNRFKQAPPWLPVGCQAGEDISADGLDNAIAAERGVTETDPLDFDTDDDGLKDGTEVLDSACLDALSVDTDGDALYDGFYDRNAVGLDVGAGVVGAGIQIGFIPWDGFDGPNNDLNDDKDENVINDPDDDDQPGEHVTLGGVPGFQETNACLEDTEADGIWDGTEYAGYEAPEYKRVSPNWNSTAALLADTDIDMVPVTMAAAPDGLRPALDPDSDGDLLCDGDISLPTSTGCNGDGVLDDANGDWLDDDTGLIWLIGEDITEPAGVQNGQETWPMAWDTDGDRVDDGTEVVWYERFDCGPRVYRADLLAWDCDGDGDRNALDTDSDSDGLPDGWIDFDADGARDPNEGEDFDLFAAPGLGDAFNGTILGDTNLDRRWAVDPRDGGMPGGLPQPGWPPFGAMLGVDPEVWLESDPLNKDTDQDGIWDGDEANSPLHNPGVCYSLWNADSDYDGMADGWFDRNLDGVVQMWEGEGLTRVPGTFALDPTIDVYHLDAMIAGDSGLMEVGGAIIPVPGFGQDGVIAWHETWLETNPCNVDSDEDGARDYVEVWGWEGGNLITNGWEEGVPVGSLNDGPVAMPDPDGDGKFDAVDPNSDGLIPPPYTTRLPEGDYTYVGDSVCDANLGAGAVWQPNPFLPNAGAGKVRVYQRVSPGGVFNPDEASPFQTWREVCNLFELTYAGLPYNPIIGGFQFGEDHQLYFVDGGVAGSGDGVIGYGGFYASNPVWNAFEANNVWVPQWPYQNLGTPGDWTSIQQIPVDWNVYFWQRPTVAPPPFSGFDRDNWEYPDAMAPLGSTQEFLAVGDWDRDRVIDDMDEEGNGGYVVPGFDDLFNLSGEFAALYRLVEDWGEIDPLNADTDGDGIVDNFERTANYSGETNPRPGFCEDDTRWGPVTRDQDFDGALDGAEDVDGDGDYFSGLVLVNDIPWICASDDPGTSTCVPGKFAGTGTEARPNPNSTGVEIDPCDPDTDGDGLLDGEELYVTFTDPADTDSNDNGIPDGEELVPNCSIYDFNNDGIIDIIDIGMVASRWMNPALYDPMFDVAPFPGGDGMIDIADISAVAVRFGETCP